MCAVLAMCPTVARAAESPASDPDPWTVRGAADHAAPGASGDHAEPPVRDRLTFYGWQNMLIGEAGVGAFVLGIRFSAPLAAGGLIVALAGGPAVHGIHGRPKKAIGSVLINIGLPVTGLAIGATLATVRHANAGYWSVVGLELGLAAAPIVDGLALGFARERIGRARAGLTGFITPVVGALPSSDGRSASFVLGAAGTF